MVDEESFLTARNRPEVGEALDQFARLIVRIFVDILTAGDVVKLGPWFKTREGKKAFREARPGIVDAYFQALFNPKRLGALPHWKFRRRLYS